jgi:YcaO-like protein with predicted kinase domain
MIGFDRALKVYGGGTDRVATPAETLARAEAVRRLVGITRVANVTGLDHIGIPVVTVCRPNSRSLAVFQGKGLTLEAAKASGIMEAIEAFHAERIEAPLLLSSYRDLHLRRPTVDVDRLPRLETSHFHQALEILWIEAIDLVTEEEVWVPHELVHLNYRLPLPTGSGAFYVSSNGLASGNHPLESISHGICELVERDALVLRGASSAQAKARTRLDLATVDDPESRRLLDQFDRAGVAVMVWDVTSDIALPTFLCTLLDREESLRFIPPLSASGCHPRRSVALTRALTEAAQVRLTLISGSRDDLSHRVYAEARARSADRREELRSSTGSRSFQSAPSFESNDLVADVEHELRCLARAGLEQVLVVDLAKPGIDLSVVRVLIPGLEGTADLAGYVPGERARRLVVHPEA